MEGEENNPTRRMKINRVLNLAIKPPARTWNFLFLSGGAYLLLLPIGIITSTGYWRRVFKASEYSSTPSLQRRHVFGILERDRPRGVRKSVSRRHRSRSIDFDGLAANR